VSAYGVPFGPNCTSATVYSSWLCLCSACLRYLYSGYNHGYSTYLLHSATWATLINGPRKLGITNVGGNQQLPNGSAGHRRSCGDVQSLVWRYASPNCSVCAPRAEGLNHMISDGKFRDTHRVTLGKRRLLQQLQENLFDGSNTYHHYYHRRRNPYRPKRSRTTT
jgi:hypothetical protein